MKYITADKTFAAACYAVFMFAVLIAALFHEPGNPATVLTLDETSWQQCTVLFL